MDTNKAKSKTNKKQVNYIEVERADVRNVRVVETKSGDIIFFTLMLNGVFINNCKVISGKNGDFISFPQYKGNDDKWYNVVYAPLSDEDQKSILDLVQDALNEED